MKMKTYIMAAAIVCGALISAEANLLTNPNFDLDTNGVQFVDTEIFHPWSEVQAWSGSGGETRGSYPDDNMGEAHPTAAMAGKIGLWGNPWNHFIGQDSGVIAQPNTEYTFTVDLNNNSIWRSVLSFQTVEDGVWAVSGSVATPQLNVPANAWTEFSFVLDTAVNPEFVGKNIGVKVILKDSDGGFLQATNASLTAIPEPGTLGLMASFGAGIFFVRKKFRV